MRASIFTKLGLYVKVVTISSWIYFGRPAPRSAAGRNFLSITSCAQPVVRPPQYTPVPASGNLQAFAFQRYGRVSVTALSGLVSLTSDPLTLEVVLNVTLSIPVARKTFLSILVFLRLFFLISSYVKLTTWRYNLDFLPLMSPRILMMRVIIFHPHGMVEVRRSSCSKQYNWLSITEEC